MDSKRREKKMRLRDDDIDSSIRLHTKCCDKLYRWSMWRMYLNEELSRVLTARFDYSDTSKSITKSTAPYLKHRDGLKYGRHMKKMYHTNTNKTRCVDSLPDNVYLVYGLPRASIRNVPEEVKRLYDNGTTRAGTSSSHTSQRDTTTSEITDAGEQITKMFEFVTSDFTKGDVSQLTFRKLGDNRSHISNGRNGKIPAHQQEQAKTIRRRIALPGDDGVERTFEADPDDAGVPLVSKSRLFWERLASKKTDIIELKYKNKTGQATDSTKDTSKYVIPPAPTNPDNKQLTNHVIPPAPVFTIKKQTPQHVVPAPPRQPDVTHDVVPDSKPPETDQTTDAGGISSEILQKQQKLLKKTIPKRTSKDLWRTIRERKTEILQLREMNDTDSNQEKRRESKTNQLWSFLFSKKKELLHIKQGSKANQEASHKGHHHHNHGKKHHSTDNNNVIPNNFEDNFQKELAAKLQKRREMSNASQTQ